MLDVRNPILTYSIGIVTAVVVLLVLATFVDESVSRFFISWPDDAIEFFAYVTDFGKSDWLLIPSCVIALVGLVLMRLPFSYCWKWAVRSLTGLSAFIFIGVGFPGLIAAILKRVLGRARPIYLEEWGTLHFVPFSWGDWTLQSFPSGHSTTSMAFSVVLIVLANGHWKVFFTLIAVVIGVSRISLGMHFLTDVITGFSLGALGAFMVRDYFVTRNWGLRATSAGVKVRWYGGFRPLLRALKRGQIPALFK